METTVKQRLTTFIESQGIKTARFESLCGLGNGYVNKLKGEPGSRKLDDILRVFPKLNRDWLLYGEGTMLKTHNSGDITITDVRNSNISNVGHGNTYTTPGERCLAPKGACACAIYPVVPTHVLRAPDINIAEWIEKNIDNCKKIDIKQAIGKVSHAQPMTSRAMEPRIPEGAMLFMREVDSWDEALLDGSVYGVDVNRPHMIVRKVYDEGDFVRCEPVNPEFGPIRVPKSKVMNLYKIAAVLKICD